MAIISVLWGIGLLAVLTVSLIWSGTTSSRMTHNVLVSAEINVAAEASLNRAYLALIAPRNDRRWRVDGGANNFEFNGVRMKISIQDELGRIDLNHAQAAMLIGLLQSVGLDPQSASNLADNILDWRDSSARRVNDAKGLANRATGTPYRPRNGPFQSVDELRLVMDMTPALFSRIEPTLTVYSGRQFIDPQVAPREVLLALPTMDPGKVDTLISLRRANQDVGGVSTEQSLRGRAFAIRTEFEKPYERYVQKATIRLTENPEQPYWVLSWSTKAHD